MAIPLAIRSGIKFFGKDQESGQSWWLFPVLTEEQVLDVLDINHIESYSDGPGMGYARRPVIRTQNSRTLITQMFGLDI